MAMKAMLCLLAYVLLVTTRVSLFVEAIETENVVATPPAKAPPPAHPPTKPYVHPPVKAPPPAHPPTKPYVHPPVKAPIHPPHPHPYPHPHVPAKAPAHAPEKHHHDHAPKKAPYKHHAHPPKTGPIHHPPVKSGAPVPSMAPKHGCYPMCEEYCKKDHHKKRPCLKVCIVCCEKSKCVPEHKKKCSDWDYAKIGGKMVKCP